MSWVAFDFEQPDTYAAAVQGVDKAFLIARPGDDHSDRTSIPLIDIMQRHGVRHVVDLSAIGVEGREDFALRKIERHLEASGLAYTHLRPNFFMELFTVWPLYDALMATGALRLPAADARLSYIAAADIADVAVAALTQPGHEGQAYTLTGPEALDHDTIVRVISAASGRSFRYEALDEDDARAGMAASGLSPARIERLIGFYRLVRRGACAPVCDDVQRVLGRPATTLQAFAGEHAAIWQPEGSPIGS
jgi:uncharacterized protein YbjT (DUF2867 family)